MKDIQILRNECEQAMLQMESAFLKCVGKGEGWTYTAHVAQALRFDDLVPGYGAAFSRSMASRLQAKGLVEMQGAPNYGQWVKVRRRNA